MQPFMVQEAAKKGAGSPEVGDKALLRHGEAQDGEAAPPVHRNLSESSELWRQYGKYAA